MIRSDSVTMTIEAMNRIAADKVVKALHLDKTELSAMKGLVRFSHIM